MEKVYVLTEVTPNMDFDGYGYSETKVVGVFSTFEAVKQFMEANPTRSWAYHDWEEFEVQK